MPREDAPKPKKLIMPQFESTTVVQKVIETNKLDRTKFQQRDPEDEPKKREAVRPRKLQTEFMKVGEEPQSFEKKGPQPKKLVIPQYGSKTFIQKEVMDTRKLERSIVDQKEPQMDMKRKDVVDWKRDLEIRG
jgi:hypothetical protein